MISNVDGSPQIIAGLTTFTPTIPKFYWDVDSQEQGIHQLCKTVQKIIDYLDTVTETVNIAAEEFEELKALFKKFQESGFEDYYKKQLEEWFNKNAFEIYKLLARQVFFGLTSDGHFCAYVPDSWSEIEFDTGAAYGTYTYGHLILRYNVDGSGVIDNTSYGESVSPDQYKQLMSEINGIKQTLYTVLNKGE